MKRKRLCLTKIVFVVLTASVWLPNEFVNALVKRHHAKKQKKYVLPTNQTQELTNSSLLHEQYKRNVHIELDANQIHSKQKRELRITNHDTQKQKTHLHNATIMTLGDQNPLPDRSKRKADPQFPMVGAEQQMDRMMAPQRYHLRSNHPGFPMQNHYAQPVMSEPLIRHSSISPFEGENRLAGQRSLRQRLIQALSRRIHEAKHDSTRSSSNERTRKNVFRKFPNDA